MNNKRFDEICGELMSLHERKNHDYGDAFSKLFKKHGMVAALIPLENKMLRIESLSNDAAMVVSESLEDSLMDLASYAIMTICELKNKDNYGKEGTEIQ